MLYRNFADKIIDGNNTGFFFNWCSNSQRLRRHPSIEEFEWDVLELICTQFCFPWRYRALNVQFQVLVNIFSMESMQRLDFTWGSHNGRVGKFSSHDSVDKARGSNPTDFISVVCILHFKVAFGMVLLEDWKLSHVLGRKLGLSLVIFLSPDANKLRLIPT